MSDNNIGDEGAKYIADMLVVNKTLQKIYLSNNNISDKGADSIAASLVINKSIRSIWLRNNKIGDQGAEKLADAFQSNHLFETLGLYDNNKIRKEVMDRIQALEHLDLNSRMLIANKMKDTAKKNRIEPNQSKALPNKRTRTEDDTQMTKDEEIALLRAKLKAQEEVITTKEKEIVSLKGALESYKPVTVDLANEEEDEPSSKRARTGDTSMEIWDKDTPRMMTRHQNQMNQAREKPIVKLENKVMGFKRCPFPQCNTIGLFTKGCSIVTCRMNMRHNGKFHHFCFYCGKSASDPGDSCNNGVCPYKIDEDSRKLYQDNLDKAFKEFSRQTRQAGGAYDVDKV